MSCRVELVNIGTELLMGFAINTHAAYLGQKLTAIGATLVRQVCVNDTAEDIERAIQQAFLHADLVITTGGLGPTSDDITRHGVIQMLGLNTHMDSRALEEMETRFRRRQIEIPESVKSQAVVPDIATVFYNENGTAPGLAIPLKNFPCKWLIMLPGPPRELQPMFEKQALPLILNEYGGSLPILDCRVFKVVGMGESSVEQMVEPALKDISDLEIGYCARAGEVDLRLVVRGKNPEIVRKIADEAESKTRCILKDAIFGMGETSLEEVVVHLLHQKNKWLTTAESCTGGHFANRITMVSGSSHVFREGWITYSDEAKMKGLDVPKKLIDEHGAVSKPVARSMAELALQKSDADYALGITGIAGPTGGTLEKPVGTVFISLATKNKIDVEHFLFQIDRETFKFMTTQTALNMLRKELLKST